jgi:uncharacterized membrane protein
MRKLLILYTILAFCLSTVSALQVSNPVLSGERDANISTTLTITNDGTATVTNLQVSSSADSKYQVKFENIPNSIAPGSSGIVTVKGRIPADFDAGKKSIGTITVTGKTGASPQNQSPQQASIPVGMSASNDCGTNTDAPSSPIIGQWHTGSCDWVPDIEVMQPFQGSIDAGWARLHSDNYLDYWVNAIAVECGNGQTQIPPNGWDFGGKIHTGPGLCDGQIELPSGDSGWIGFYSKPSAAGKLILTIADNKCGGGVQTVPATGVVLGRVRTGPNTCDGVPEAVAYNGASLDAGSMNVVYLPNEVVPQNKLPVGVFELLNSSGLSGWAYDENAPSISVDVYVDNSFWKTLQANQTRPDLISANKTPDANHGFSYSFTSADLASLDVSKNHTFHVIAINSPQGDNPTLNGSPKILAAFVSGPSNSTNITNSSNSTGSTGTVTTVTATSTLYMEAQKRLVIDKVKITCSKLETVNDGTTIDKVSPGMTCFLTVKVKNTFTDNTEIEDIEIEADPENSDVDGDTADISSLDAGDSEEKTLELQVEEDADDGKVKIDILVSGTDENNAKHEDRLSFELDIERLKHDLPISKITVNPKPAENCKTSRVDVVVYVENKGQRDENEVAVELSVPGLSFTKKVTDLSIDQDEEEKVTFSIPINSNTPFGSFTATARSFYDNSAESGKKTADVQITKCASQTVVQPPESNNQDFSGSSSNEQVVVPPPRTDDVIIVRPPVAEEQNSTFWSSALFTGILVMANLLALTVLGVMLYGFRKKPEDPLAEQFFDEKPMEDFDAKEYY